MKRRWEGFEVGSRVFPLMSDKPAENTAKRLSIFAGYEAGKDGDFALLISRGGGKGSIFSKVICVRYYGFENVALRLVQ